MGVQDFLDTPRPGSPVEAESLRRETMRLGYACAEKMPSDLQYKTTRS